MTPLLFREELRRAVLTILVAPDPDARFLRQRSAWPTTVVDLARDAYGALPERMRLITPSPYDLSQAEIVTEWLAWLRREHGQESLNIVIVWALGTPTWRVAQRYHVHQRTIRYRIDRALSLLYVYSIGVADPLAVNVTPELFDHGVIVDNTVELGHAKFENSGRGVINTSAPALPSKVWVGDRDGGHWRKNGRRWRDGTEGIE